MTQLQGDQQLKRSLNVLGMELVVTISAEGIVFKPKRGKLGITATWPAIIEASRTPDNSPSRFCGVPVEWLKHQSNKITAKNKTKEQIAP
jgi:hypothetical protein